MPVDARPTLAAPDDDPYLWLEEIEGARALAWVDDAERRYAGEIRHAGLRHGPRHARSHPRPAGQHSVRHAARAASLQFLEGCQQPARPVARTTLDSFRTAQPSWEILLDVDALAAQEKRGLGLARRCDAAGHRTIGPSFSLSRGGSDAAVLREFDIAAKAFVTGGFYLPEAKGGIDWLDRDTLLLSSAYGEGHGDQVRLLANRSAVAARIGCRSGADAASRRRPRAWACGRRSIAREQPETVWFVDRPGFFDAIVWIGDRSGPKVKLDLPTDIELEAHRDWLVVKRRTPWTIGGKTYAPDTLLGIVAVRHFSPASRDFTVLFEPGERRALQHFFWSDGQLVAVDPRRAEARVRGR